MAPTPTSKEDGHLEHPAQAFERYRADGVERVVCEEKHMGSRAVALVCRDAGAAAGRFGVTGPTGALYTRTGRPFFTDPEVTEQILGRPRTAIGAAGLWDELDTDWLLLDGELMPWSRSRSTRGSDARRRGRALGPAPTGRRPGAQGRRG